MGLEGAVKLGYKKELESISNPVERQAVFEERVSTLYEQGKAVNYATYFEIDNVIDPAESRQWIVACMKAMPAASKGGERKKKRNFIDTW
jgi:acetyl-CoA carboxylase carboxyltransferase component